MAYPFALAAIVAVGGALVALWLGWYIPLAAPLATLLAAAVASRPLGRPAAAPPR